MTSNGAPGRRDACRLLAGLLGGALLAGCSIPRGPADTPATPAPAGHPAPAPSQTGPTEQPPAARPTATADPQPTPEPPRPTPEPTPRPTDQPPQRPAGGGPTGGVRELKARSIHDQVYYLYVPPSYDGRATHRLLVAVHGSSRTAERYAERFVEFADRNRYIVLAPLFDDSLDYQLLGIGDDARADRRLLRLVDELAERYAIDRDRFDLFGYSGGGQFAHRFLYFYPERLRAVAIGAPGTVTLPTDRLPWPAGFDGLERIRGATLDLERLKQTRVLLVVGREDTDDEDLNEEDWAMRAGDNRLERARRLHAAWDRAGVSHEYLELPGVGHDTDGVLEPVRRFLLGG